MWHLRETVSQVKKSHCHAYERDLACFKILLYHFGLRRSRVPLAHIYREPALVFRGLKEGVCDALHCDFLPRENDIDAVLDNRGTSGLAVWRQEKDLTVGPSRPRHQKG